MKEYLEEIFQDFGEELPKIASTPAKIDIFEVNKGFQSLHKYQSELFTELYRNFCVWLREVDKTLN